MKSDNRSVKGPEKSSMHKSVVVEWTARVDETHPSDIMVLDSIPVSLCPLSSRKPADALLGARE